MTIPFQRHLAAGFLSRIYAGVINLVTVPVFLHWLGPETFGLIGLSATMQTLFFIMDAGFGGTITRELAGGQGDAGSTVTAVVRCRVIERFYWISAPVIAMTAFFIGAAFVVNWVGAGTISRTEMLLAISMMATTIGLQWLQGFYTAALYGTYRHTSVAVVQALIWTARTLGAIVVLLLAGKTVINYFIWQLLVAVAAVAVLRFEITRCIPPWKFHSAQGEVAKVLQNIRTVVLTASGASAALLAFNQVDKIILGLRFDLETFGYYTLTWQIAGALYLIYNPIYNMYLPLTVSALVVDDRRMFLARARDGAVLIAALVIPVSTVIAVYAPQVVHLWTGDIATAERAGPFLRLTFAGAACHALFFGPYFVQMALGKTEITLRVVAGIFLLMAPLMVLSAYLGAGVLSTIAIWAISSLCFLVITTLLTAARLLDVQPWKWLLSTVITPIGAAVVAGAVLSLWPPVYDSRILVLLHVFAAWLGVTAFLMIVSPKSRRVLRDAIQGLVGSMQRSQS